MSLDTLPGARIIDAGYAAQRCAGIGLSMTSQTPKTMLSPKVASNVDFDRFSFWDATDDAFAKYLVYCQRFHTAVLENSKFCASYNKIYDLH